jgi:hypothetical protein
VCLPAAANPQEKTEQFFAHQNFEISDSSSCLQNQVIFPIKKRVPNSTDSRFESFPWKKKIFRKVTQLCQSLEPIANQ